MKRQSILFAALVAAFAYNSASLAVSPDIPTVNGVPIPDLNAGFVDASGTNIVSVNPTTPSVINVLPPRATGFRVRAYGGDMVMGSQNDVATSPYVVGVGISSGSFTDWGGLASNTQGNFYLLMEGTANGTATVTPWGFP